MLLYISLKCSQKCLCVYAQIFVYKLKSVSEDAFLFILIFGFPRTTSSICLYFNLKKCHSVYAHVRVSIYASTYICLLQGYPSPIPYMQKCPSVYASITVSNVASQYAPILGFPKIPIPKCLYMSLFICPICFSIQGVTGGMCETSGECSLC